ncbi:hypothetical protein BC829DRAFT_436125 [Chytridium lagenaria]|nr:hypothetical protein BC829DRAFT_436125 [Chytridium lagenaria]
MLERKGKGRVDLDDREMLKCLQSNEEAVDEFLAAHDEVEEVTREVTKLKEKVDVSQNERDRLKNELENAKQAVTKILGALCDSEMGKVLNEAMEIEALKDHYLLVSQVVSRVKNVTKLSKH